MKGIKTPLSEALRGLAHEKHFFIEHYPRGIIFLRHKKTRAFAINPVNGSPSFSVDEAQAFLANV